MAKCRKKVYKIKAVYGGNENYNNISSEIYTIDLTEHQQTKYPIAVLNDGHGTASANLLQAAAGNEVVLTAKPNDGFRFKEWDVLKGDVIILENKFTMPAKEVEIRAIFEEDAYAVTIETDGNGEASANPENAIVGDTVQLSATPKEGFRFKKWQVLEGDVTVVDDTFTMPAKHVKIKAIFEKAKEDQTKYPIMIESDGNGQANTNILQSVEGSTITLTATPNVGFRFKEWQVLEGDVTVVDDTFTMPAKPVKIKAIFERVTSGGGSGGGSSNKNPDTTDKQQETGTKTETITKPDGFVVTTTKNDDGSSVIKVETKEGSTSVTTVDKEGNMNENRSQNSRKSDYRNTGKSCCSANSSSCCAKRNKKYTNHTGGYWKCKRCHVVCSYRKSKHKHGCCCNETRWYKRSRA